jgi:cytoskeletal protein CcmA (bactofilin family)
MPGSTAGETPATTRFMESASKQWVVGFARDRCDESLTDGQQLPLLRPLVYRINDMDKPMTTPGSSKNVLTSDVEIKGNLKFSGELTFEGKLEGEINSDGTLVLGDTAAINGNINVNSVVVRGKVNGNVIAKDKLELKSKAELFGDIRASKLAIEEGVTFVGKTEVNPNKVAPSPAPRPPAIPTAEPVKRSP